MPVDVVVIQAIPQGSLVALSGVPEADRDALTEQIYQAAGHRQVAVVYTEPTGKKAAQLHTTDEMAAVLRASMADEVRVEVKADARAEAIDVVQGIITERGGGA